MASFKMISSSTSDLSRRNSSSASSSPSIRSSHHLRPNPHADYTFASDSNPIDVDRSIGDRNSVNNGKSVDDVWKEIVSGERDQKMKEEVQEEEDVIMTLEDFLARAGMNDDGETNLDVKIPMMSLPQRDNSFQMIEGGGGSMRGKRGRVMIEAMDKAAVQRQKRMIKNRESAARSRERKQAYQVSLERLATKLEEENEKLLKEIEECTKERYKKLMEVLIPVDEKEKLKPSSSRSFSRSYSL